MSLHEHGVHPPRPSCNTMWAEQVGTLLSKQRRATSPHPVTQNWGLFFSAFPPVEKQLNYFEVEQDSAYAAPKGSLTLTNSTTKKTEVLGQAKKYLWVISR